MADIPTNVALVYDRVNKWGGAEQVLLALHEMFPQAPLYTAVSDLRAAPWAQVFPQVIPSFLNRFPWAKSAHEIYPWLTPLAFEAFDFSAFDAVISVTSADAKGIVTKPGTFHLCYCLTPTRYLYSHPVPLLGFLKTWDQIASRRPDAYLAISRTVQSRIKTYYGLDSTVIHPPANIEKFMFNDKWSMVNDKYFLSVGRLVYHKRPDLLIKLFNDLKLPLVIAGTGRMESRLRRMAAPHVRFAGLVSDRELQQLYRHALGYVSVHEEDFGLVYVEAQAAGLPILALNHGGVGEIVTHGQTGLLFDDLSDLGQALQAFDLARFDRPAIAATAARFSKERFHQEFAKVFQDLWTKYKNIYTF